MLPNDQRGEGGEEEGNDFTVAPRENHVRYHFCNVCFTVVFFNSVTEL